MTWDDLKKELSQRYLEQGREEGKEEGREEGKEEMVCKMFKKGLNMEQISNLTDLPLETVMEIKAKYNI